MTVVIPADDITERGVVIDWTTEHMVRIRQGDKAIHLEPHVARSMAFVIMGMAEWRMSIPKQPIPGEKT